MTRASIYIFIGLVLAAITDTFAAVSVTAQFERSSIIAGETAVLNVIVEGGRPESTETPPPVEGLTVQYQGNAQNISSINGVTTVQHILRFAVSTTTPGQYTIPAIGVTVGGTQYRTQPIALTVSKADPSAQNRLAFLRLNVPRQEVFVGEIFPVELQLYVVEAEDSQPPQLKSDGFVVHKQVEQGRTRAQVANTLYTVITFRMSVSAAKAGKLTLGPAEMKMVLRIRQRPDPNDPFGFFNRIQRRSVTLTSAPVEMNVHPLPTPVPTDFSGAIGVFNWTVNAGPTNLAAGDPVTLKVAINGRGNLDNLKLPTLDWPGFKAYPPSSATVSDDPLGIEGTRNFEQVIVPQDATIKELPALTVSYFNPESKSYAQLAQPPAAITVRPGAGGTSQPQFAANASEGSEEEPAARNDIVHLKTEPGPILATTTPLIRQPWFLLLQMIPFAGLISVTLWRKRMDKLANNPRLRRKLEVQRTLQTGIAELKSLAAAQEADSFYALLFRLLQEQLGERLDLPASAITEAVLETRLAQKGASPELIERLHRLFQICNQARYAPVRTNAELLSLSSELESVVGELQRLPD